MAATAGLTPERWAKIKSILHRVQEHTSAEQAKLLDLECGGDDDLRREVESLIAAEANAAGFLEAPAVSMPPPHAAQFAPGQRIGQYQIVQEVGEGGMGFVYQALREDIRKLVAIKVVKQEMRSGFGINRFFAERQILAHLDHPYVTKLLDSGLSTDGRPYFVMEFIAGEEIDVYCDRRRLSTRARLELFLKVCAGVEYAHRSLVVHRDLKPRNILVTADGDPKLLDFGIAKILEEDPLTGALNDTVTIVRMMTPEYASPEQVRGMPVNTASDVYSLGVLLYELVTGHRPYRLKGRTPSEAGEVISRQEPSRPSAVVRRAVPSDVPGGETLSPEAVSAARDASPARLERALSGDVDRIVLKALEKEPDRRYGSVERLADDIRRHLDGLPVLARKPSLAYRLGKFTRRHKAAVIGAIVVALSLIAGIVATAREAHVANLQRARAEKRFQDVRSLANSLLFELHDAIRDLPGSTPARELLVSRALQYLDSLNAEAAGDAGLRRELAAAYEKVADVQGGYRAANLGNIAGAIASYRRALAIREALDREGQADDALRRDLVRNHGKLSDVLLHTGSAAEALEHSRRLLEIAQRLAAKNPASPVDQGLLGASYGDLGWKEAGRGDWQAALEDLKKSTTLFEQLAGGHPQDAGIRRRLALCYDRYGSVIAGYTANYSEALALHRKYLAAANALTTAEPLNADLRRIAAYAHMDIGSDLLLSGNADGARPEFAVALAEVERLSEADPKSVQYRLDVANALGLDGEAAIEQDRPAQAIRILERALALLEDVPLSLDRTTSAATDQLRMGRAYARLGQPSKARVWFQRSLPGLEEARQRGSLQGRDLRLPDEARRGL
jgi:non-specific serine/threonine protein kinase/serine/threonine-protein kinase